jgi:hypothetical protein
VSTRTPVRSPGCAFHFIFTETFTFMKLLNSLAICAMLLASHSALAVEGSAPNAMIERLQINKNLGNMVFIRLAAAPVVRAACSTHGTWHFLLSLEDAAGRNQYAQLLIAYSTGQAVDVSGSGLCGWGTIEDLNAVALHM